MRVRTHVLDDENNNSNPRSPHAGQNPFACLFASLFELRISNFEPPLPHYQIPRRRGGVSNHHFTISPNYQILAGALMLQILNNADFSHDDGQPRILPEDGGILKLPNYQITKFPNPEALRSQASNHHFAKSPNHQILYMHLCFKI